MDTHITPTCTNFRRQGKCLIDFSFFSLIKIFFHNYINNITIQIKQEKKKKKSNLHHFVQIHTQMKNKENFN